MRESGSISKRQEGHVVRCGFVNHGRRHAVWKTCEHGSATTLGRSLGGLYSLSSERPSGDEDRVLESVAVGLSVSIVASAERALLELPVSADCAASNPPPSELSFSQQIEQTDSPPSPPTRSIRSTSPDGTSSNPRMRRPARSGSSCSSRGALNGKNGKKPGCAKP